MKAELIQFTEIPDILPSHPVISIAGAGGKTTLMFALAKTLSGTVITTTTTKVGEHQIKSADMQIPLSDFPPTKTKKIIWVSPSLLPHNGKITGCGESEFTRLAAISARNNWPLIAETDGAAMRHIKAPAAHEPVIPPECNICFYLVGLDVLGLPLNAENVHRPDLFSEITGLKQGDSITTNSVIRLLEHPEGGLKNVPDNTLHLAYLTHADTKERKTAGQNIAEKLEHYSYVCMN